ncbi:MAG: aminoglycoside phosphotransferase family protein [Candidatus Falkowbacteria bacterium]
MSRVEELFDKKYLTDLLWRKLPPLYPRLKEILDIEIIPIKKHIWIDTYHVVTQIKTRILTFSGREITIPIYYSAHSDEPRRNVYDALKFLWDNGFNSQHLSIPRPLFYSEYLNATFYRGVNGKDLRYFIKKEDQVEITRVVEQSAKWFAKLHSLDNIKKFNFSTENSRIRSVLPGVNRLFKDIARKYPHYSEFYKHAYAIFLKKEEDFLASTEKRWLIHGDAHPGNIIKINDIEIAAIDFTDMSPADFARDLGCFLQQFEYMAVRTGLDHDFISKMKQLFLDTYFKNSDEKLDASLQDRIDNYYNWTLMRTISYLLFSGVINRDEGKLIRINNLITQLKEDLGI